MNYFIRLKRKLVNDFNNRIKNICIIFDVDIVFKHSSCEHCVLKEISSFVGALTTWWFTAITFIYLNVQSTTSVDYIRNINRRTVNKVIMNVSQFWKIHKYIKFGAITLFKVYCVTSIYKCYRGIWFEIRRSVRNVFLISSLHVHKYYGNT